MLKKLDMSVPAERREFINFVGAKALDAAVSRLGAGFKAVTKPFPNPHEMKRADLGVDGQWRAMRLDLTRFEKLDHLIDMFLMDIAATRTRTMVRLPEIDTDQELAIRFEQNGITFRVLLHMISDQKLTATLGVPKGMIPPAIVTNERPAITLEYAGYTG